MYKNADTGLRDKNGVSICESMYVCERLHYYHHTNEWRTECTYYRVVFVPGRFALHEMPDGGVYDFEHIYSEYGVLKNVEVVSKDEAEWMEGKRF